MPTIKNNQSGQTLIELIVAIAVITIGLFSVWLLFLVNFNAEKEAEMRIVAANLAREGAEIAKNTRDSNWLRMANNLTGTDQSDLWLWDRGLDPGIYKADYALGLEQFGEGDAGQLYFDDYGYYSSVSGQKPSPYLRQVTLADICCQDSGDDQKCDDTNYFIDVDNNNCPLKIGVHVSSQVSWAYSGQARQLTVEDELFNWR